MEAPYRGVAHVESLEAPTRRGRLRLEIAPRHVQLDIAGVLNSVVHEDFLTWIVLPPEGKRRLPWRKKKPRKRSVRLADGQLLVARSHLTEELSLWFEEKPDRFRRLLAIEPVVLLDAAALDAWKCLERIGHRFRSAVAAHSRGARDAVEFGRGQHRALWVEYDDHAVMLARPVFRERQRPVFRIYKTGEVEDLKTGESGRCVSRYSVTIGGDRIRFDEVTGKRAAELYMPWVSPEDREEIARRARLMIDGAALLPARAETEADTRASDAPADALPAAVPGR